MLTHPKEKRILQAKEFRFVFQSANKIKGNKFALLTRRNNKKLPRLGFALAKKQIPQAVNRNRIKRLCRESFRQQLHLPPVDAVVIAYKGLDDISNKEIIHSLEKAWDNLARHYNRSDSSASRDTSI